MNAPRHVGIALLATAVLAIVACSGGSGDVGAPLGVPAEHDDGGSGDAGTDARVPTSGGNACARAGGTCLSSAGASCASGQVSDPSASCEPANGGDGPNTPCCIPFDPSRACQGLSATAVKPPTKCGDATCGAGTTHCETVVPGVPGGSSTTTCAAREACAACLSCACILRFDDSKSCSCTESNGVVSLTCNAS